MFIIILWLLLHAKHNYRKQRKKRKKTGRKRERGRRIKRERNVTPAISAGLSKDIIILYRYTHTYTHHTHLDI